MNDFKTHLQRLNAKITEFRDPRDTSNHTIRRLILGNTISTAIAAPKGKKWAAAGEAYGNSFTHSLKGLAIGAGAGALGGAALGLHPAAKGRAAGLVLGGALAGGAVGDAVGTLRGELGEKGDEIHKRYQRMKR